MVYEKLKSQVDSPLIVGAVSGGAAKLIVYPLDTLKKRMQAVGMPHAERFGTYDYDSLFHKRHTATAILRNEGWLALYRGTVPSLLKAGLSTSVAFYAYETACVLLAQLPMMTNTLE